MYMIILAAGQGTRLRPLTDKCPKCLVELGGRALLDWQIITANEVGIHDIAVVTGYLRDTINFPGVTYLENPAYETTNMVETLWCAESLFKNGFIVSYGDIVYEASILDRLLHEPHDISVVVDQGWKAYWEQRFENVLDDAETLEVDATGRITNIGQQPYDVSQIEGQYIGLMVFRNDGVIALRSVYDKAKMEDSRGRNPLGKQRPFKKLYMTDILQGIIDLGFPIHQLPIQRGWLEIDSKKDLEIAESSIERNDERLIINRQPKELKGD